MWLLELTWRRRRGPYVCLVPGIQLDNYQIILNTCNINWRCDKRNAAMLQIEKQPLFGSIVVFSLSFFHSFLDIMTRRRNLTGGSTHCQGFNQYGYK